jgi:hypothetical protein
MRGLRERCPIFAIATGAIVTYGLIIKGVHAPEFFFARTVET